MLLERHGRAGQLKDGTGVVVAVITETGLVSLSCLRVPYPRKVATFCGPRGVPRLWSPAIYLDTFEPGRKDPSLSLLPPLCPPLPQISPRPP